MDPDVALLLIEDNHGLKADVCLNATQYFLLQDGVTKACQIAQVIGIVVGLGFGLFIGYQIRKRMEDHG
jgi:hypothetical protein